MALLGGNKSETKKTNIRAVRFKIAVEKLPRTFTFSKRASWYDLPEPVKKGHFPVLGIQDGNAKKYAVPLCYLNDPSLLRLLEKEEEEFGFEHEGALCIPCGWNELDSMLGLDRHTWHNFGVRVVTFTTFPQQVLFSMYDADKSE